MRVRVSSCEFVTVRVLVGPKMNAFWIHYWFLVQLCMNIRLYFFARPPADNMKAFFSRRPYCTYDYFIKPNDTHAHWTPRSQCCQLWPFTFCQNGKIPEKSQFQTLKTWMVILKFQSLIPILVELATLHIQVMAFRIQN